MLAFQAERFASWWGLVAAQKLAGTKRGRRLTG